MVQGHMVRLQAAFPFAAQRGGPAADHSCGQSSTDTCLSTRRTPIQDDARNAPLGPSAALHHCRLWCREIRTTQTRRTLLQAMRFTLSAEQWHPPRGLERHLMAALPWQGNVYTDAIADFAR